MSAPGCTKTLATLQCPLTHKLPTTATHCQLHSLGRFLRPSLVDHIPFAFQQGTALGQHGFNLRYPKAALGVLPSLLMLLLQPLKRCF